MGKPSLGFLLYFSGFLYPLLSCQELSVFKIVIEGSISLNN